MRRQMAELQLNTAGQPATSGNMLASPDGQAGQARPSLAAALDAADMYFSGQRNGLVNQNQAQTVYTPAEERGLGENLMD